MTNGHPAKYAREGLSIRQMRYGNSHANAGDSKNGFNSMECQEFGDQRTNAAP
jgi:hypothetical protein